MVLAFISVWTRSRLLDRAITIIALAGISIPGFVTGIVLLLIFSVKLHLVASISYIPFSEGIAKNLEAMALPAVTLGLSLFPTQMRVLRGDMLEQLDNEDYVALAKTKGLSKAGVIFKHVLRNSATSFVTLLALQLGFLIGGAVIIEQVFTINGIGDLLLTSIFNRDATMVEGIILVIGVAVVTLNLIADVIYMLLDPRVRYE
jgi:peptide/nickel transport system permease protein